MLYSVYGGEVEEVVVVGIEISKGGAMLGSVFAMAEEEKVLRGVDETLS